VTPASAGLLFGLFFGPEDGGYIFLLNYAFCSNYTVFQPRRPYSSWKHLYVFLDLDKVSLLFTQ
jgi:hypothetical protein